ncbi:hypothetical protein CHS0354_033266 [Potamilus streckersoni]|uniref:Coilin n=1 Tax=Potamilus streckersoni TaxID=2493646 RepID=A0AAE0VQD9_9BIVA|nr:hypothetical protein CHS0354_033266 [Potamilus streckersoni]
MGEHARIKLQFLNFSCEPCWMLVDFNEMKCIGDVMIKIKEEYLEDVSDVNLYLDGCILPKKESSLILRDNDCVCIRVEENPQEKVIKKRKKKKDLKDEEVSKSSVNMLERNKVSSVICLQHSETEVPYESAKQCQSDTLSGNMYAENSHKLKKKKRKYMYNEEMDDRQEQKKQKFDSSMTHIVSTFSNATLQYSDAASKPAVNKSVSQSEGKNEDEESDKNQSKEISKTKTCASSSITTTIMEKDKILEVEDGVQQHIVSERKKRKRHRTRKRRKREKGSGNTNNSEGLFENAKNGHKTFSEQSAFIHDKGNMSEASLSFVSYSDSKHHLHFESSDDEEQHSSINVDGTVLLPNTVVSQMKITDVYHHSDEDNANFAEEDTNGTKNKQSGKAQERNKHSRQKDSQKIPKYNVADQGGNNFLEMVTNQTNKKNNRKVNEQSDSAVSDEIVTQIQDDSLNADTSALYVSVLSNGVPVFSRQRRPAVCTVSQNKSPQINIVGKGVSQNGCSQTRDGDKGSSQDVSPKKETRGHGVGQTTWGSGSFQKGFRQLSKQEQLSTQAYNSSVVLVNVSGHVQSQKSPINPWKNAGCTPMNVEADNIVEEENEDGDAGNLTAVPVGLDISGCPQLHGPPRVGDMIAYKILEMSSNYTPEISSYKRAEVLNYDPTTGMVTLHNLDQSQEERPIGKFDLVLHEDDSDCGLTNVLDSEDEVQISWSSVIEPRLLKT